MTKLLDTAQMKGATLSVKGMRKSFGQTLVVSDVNLEIKQGQLLSLLGPSGCGKTTALRIIAGFEEADAGSILVDGRDISSLPVHRRNLGMVFQSYSVFPHMTVFENVAFGLKMAGVAKAEITRRVRKQLETVQLERFADRFPKQLSGGQQQRVALARSLITSPSILLLDEPFSALDKNLREGMQFELRDLQKRLGITTIMVTHDQEEALTMSDAVAVMSHGKVLQIGSPDEVYNHPSSRDVAEFLGSINLFPCNITSRGGDLTELSYKEGPTEARFLVPTEKIPQDTTDLLVAVRPERLVVQSMQGRGGTLPATVRQHAFRGSFHTVLLDVAGRAEPIVYSYRDRDLDDISLEVGSPVTVSWRPQDVIVLSEAC